MILLIDNNDGCGQQDYTAWVDAEHLPKIARRLNHVAAMTISLVSGDPGFTAPASDAKVILQCGSGLNLFTGYLAMAPEQQYLGVGHQGPAWRYSLMAVDDSCLLDHNALAGANALCLPDRATRCVRWPTMCCPEAWTSRACRMSAPFTSSRLCRRRRGRSTRRS